MNTRFVFAAALIIAATPFPYAQQMPLPGPASPPAQGRASERPDPDVVAKLQSAPTLPYKVDANWPQLPKGYNFGECSGVDVDKQGNVWVFNRGHWPVMEFDRAGKMLQAWSVDSMRTQHTHGLRVAPDGNIWLVDQMGHMVFKVSPEGRILMTLGGRQGLPGNNDAVDGFNQPTNINFRANGNFYITDGYINSRVIEFAPDGSYVKHWGKFGQGDGEFRLVHDIAVDTQGRLYVADRANERVQVFDADGKYLAKWTNIGAPWGLYFSAKENAIFMCDGKYDRITKYTLEGKMLGTLSSYGRAPGKLDFAHSIAVDPADGSLYTVEIKSWRVQKWLKQGQ